MEHTRKLYLTDNLNKVYKQLERSPAKVARAQSSIQLSNVLENEGLSEDEKVREYIAALHRYLNLNTDQQSRQQQQQQQQMKRRRTYHPAYPTIKVRRRSRGRSRIRKVLPTTPPPPDTIYYYSDYTDDDLNDDVIIHHHHHQPTETQRATATSTKLDQDPSMVPVDVTKKKQRTSQREKKKPAKYETGDWSV